MGSFGTVGLLPTIIGRAVAGGKTLPGPFMSAIFVGFAILLHF